MRIKTRICILELDILLILVVTLALISEKFYRYINYFFACFLFILFHELMHITVGYILNKKLYKLKLSLCGVCAIFEKEKKESIYKNILIYIAGPLSNILLVYIFSNNKLIKEINLTLAILNLIPIYPLDGYNILFNFFEIFKTDKKILDIIGNILIILFLLISGYQLVVYHNISTLIFTVYLFVLKLNEKYK